MKSSICTAKRVAGIFMTKQVLIDNTYHRILSSSRFDISTQQSKDEKGQEQRHIMRAYMNNFKINKMKVSSKTEL